MTVVPALCPFSVALMDVAPVGIVTVGVLQ